MGMGAGQAAALAPDLGRAKPAIQSIFALMDRVCDNSFSPFRWFNYVQANLSKLQTCEIFIQVPRIYGGSSFGKQPEEIKV
jgi:hypothetical protein